MNEHVLLNYGIIRSFHDNQKSITSAFLPIVEYGLALIFNAGKEYYDNQTLGEIINKKTGVKIPELTLRNLLKILEKDQLIEFIDRNHFRIFNSSQLSTQNYFDTLNSTTRRLHKFIDEYKKYTNDERDDDEIKDELYDFIHFKVYYSADKQYQTLKYDKFFKFIEHIYQQEDELVKIFQDINFGCTLCSLMEKEENLETIKLRDFTIYLDSNFILRLLDLQEECFTNETKELFELLKKSGAKLLIFEETIREVISVLEYYKVKYIKEKKFISSLYAASKINGVFGAYFRKNLTISQIDNIIDSVPDRIRDLGISEDYISRYKIDLNEIEITKLYEKKYGNSEVITDDYWYQKCKNYITIIEIIKWRRRNKKIYPRCFANSKFIFLTCDWKLYRYNLSAQKQGLGFPEVIIQEAIVDDLMLFFPETHSQLSTELLISAYKASQYLNVQDLADLNNNIQVILKEDSSLSKYVIKATTNIDNYAQITLMYNEGTDSLDGLKKIVEKQKLQEDLLEKQHSIQKEKELLESFEKGKDVGAQIANDENLKRKATHIANKHKILKIIAMIILIAVPIVLIILLATKTINIPDNYINQTTQWVITCLISILSIIGSACFGKFLITDEEAIYKKLKKKGDGKSKH